MHVGDLNPSRAGLEVFKVDEDASKPSSWFADARTGQVIWSTPASGDNGRGVSADIWSGSAGAESWSAAVDGLRSPTGAVVSSRKPGSINFLAWWDGDPVRELLDGTHIDKYGTSSDTRLLTGADVHSNNGTKSTPSLSGDLLGDWREEVIWPTSDNTALRIYSTPIADRPPDHHAAPGHSVPGRPGLAEHGLQPAAAPELLHRQRHGNPTPARSRLKPEHGGGGDDGARKSSPPPALTAAWARPGMRWAYRRGPTRHPHRLPLFPTSRPAKRAVTCTHPDP